MSEVQTNVTMGSSSPAVETPTAPVEIQSTAPEAPKVETPPADERIERQIISLTRKERELQKQFSEMKRQKAEMEQYMKDLNEYKSLKEKARVDPLAITRHFGIEYKQLTDQVLNDERPTPTALIDELKNEIQQLKDGLSKKEQDQQNSLREESINSFKNDIKSFVDQKGDDFELIKTFGAYDQVFQTLYDHWQETGEYADVAEAARLIESNMEAEAKKLLGLKKLSPKMEAKVEAVLDNKVQTDPGMSKTLTNTLASQGAATQKAQSYLDDDASIREAAKMLKWK